MACFMDISHEFLFFIYISLKIIYLYLAVLGLHCCVQAFSSCGARVSHCGGFSFCGAQPLGYAAFSSTVDRLSCPAGCGIFLDQRSNP